MSVLVEKFLMAVADQQLKLTLAVMNHPLPYDQYLMMQSQWQGLEISKELLRQSMAPEKESDADGLL